MNDRNQGRGGPRGGGGGSRGGKRRGGGKRHRSGSPGDNHPKPVERPPEDLPSTDFHRFDIAPHLEKALAAAGYMEPTPVQEQVIPLALDEKNVVGRSRTGTGKTVAFLLPLLALIEEVEDEDFIREGQPRGPVQVLVVVPTRELAMQVAAECEVLTRFVPVRTACVYGGTRIHAQMKALETSRVVVGTPGRLLDHIGRRTLDLSHLDAIVLDEVDRMYDLGFREDVDRILRAASNRQQTILMSATLNEDVEALISKHVGEHERILIESKSLTVDEVDQIFYFVDPRKKQDLLLALVEKEPPECGIVFVRTRFSVDRLAHRLKKKGVDCHEIHSGLPQGKRESILRQFRGGKFPLLIATDVASRGLHIDDVSHVYNFDLPDVAEDYVHRVGRTARMGQKGHAISFVTTEDGPRLTEIEKLINREIKQQQYPGFEVENPHVREDKPKPAPERQPGMPAWSKPVRRRR